MVDFFKRTRSSELQTTEISQLRQAAQPVPVSVAETAAPPREKSKSANAYRTISEVADELGVAPHVLRFWETKFPETAPGKRIGGRRYYRTEDVETIRKVKTLLYGEGYTIKGAQDFLKRSRKKKPAEGLQANSVVSGEKLTETQLLKELKTLREMLVD